MGKSKKTKRALAAEQAAARSAPKVPTSIAHVSGIKHARQVESPKSDKAKISIDLTRYDTDLDLGATSNRKDDQHRAFSRLSQVAKMTWEELREFDPEYDHHCNLESLDNFALSRLRKIKADDCDQLWRIRIGSQARIWGARYGSTMVILWWDPKHQICPSRQ